MYTKANGCFLPPLFNLDGDPPSQPEIDSYIVQSQEGIEAYHAAIKHQKQAGMRPFLMSSVLVGGVLLLTGQYFILSFLSFILFSYSLLMLGVIKIEDTSELAKCELSFKQSQPVSDETIQELAKIYPCVEGRPYYLIALTDQGREVTEGEAQALIYRHYAKLVQNQILNAREALYFNTSNMNTGYARF